MKTQKKMVKINTICVRILFAMIALIGATSNVSAQDNNTELAFLEDDSAILRTPTEKIVEESSKIIPVTDIGISFQEALKRFPFINKKGDLDKKQWKLFRAYCKSQPDIAYGKELFQKGIDYRCGHCNCKCCNGHCEWHKGHCECCCKDHECCNDYWKKSKGHHKEHHNKHHKEHTQPIKNIQPKEQ